MRMMQMLTPRQISCSVTYTRMEALIQIYGAMDNSCVANILLTAIIIIPASQFNRSQNDSSLTVLFFAF